MSRCNNGGFIIPRLLFEMATDCTDLAIMVWLIGRANFIDSTCGVRAGHQRVALVRGQIVTSIKEISEALKVPPNTIRGRLHLLQKLNFSTIKTTSTGTIITINNYDEMQDFKNYDHNQNHNQTTNGPQTDHNILTKVTKVTKVTNLNTPSEFQEIDLVKPPKKTRTPKAPKEPKPKKESIGTNEVIGRYCELFKQRYGTDTAITPATAGTFGRLTKQHGKDKAIQIVEAYFNLNDSFIAKELYPVGMIERNMNKILVAIAKTTKEPESVFDKPGIRWIE
jgi:hypothetical protein